MPAWPTSGLSTRTAGSNGNRTTAGSGQRNWCVFLGAIAVVAAVSGAYLGIAGIDDDALLDLLRLSAWTAFVVFLAAFVARPLRQLYPNRMTTRLLRNRRLVGIAVAAVGICLAAWWSTRRARSLASC